MNENLRNPAVSDGQSKITSKDNFHERELEKPSRCDIVSIFWFDSFPFGEKNYTVDHIRTLNRVTCYSKRFLQRCELG